MKSFSKNAETMKNEKPSTAEAFKNFKATKGSKPKPQDDASEVEWTQEEQSALESALRKFPGNIEIYAHREHKLICV